MRLVQAAIRPIFALAVLSLSASASQAVECLPDHLFLAPIGLDTGTTPTQMMATGDFNDDGKPDIAVAIGKYSPPGTPGRISVFLGVGPMSWAAPVQYPVPADPIGLILADFNEDGIEDLVTSCTVDQSVTVFLGQGSNGIGDGTFQLTRYPVGAKAFHVLAADFDQDGILDLAMSSDNASSVQVLRGQGSGGVGDGTFTGLTSFAIGGVSTGIVSGDWNQDGNPDLAVVRQSKGDVAILLGTGTGPLSSATFLAPTLVAVGPVPFDLDAADFNGDNDPDLAVTLTGFGGVVVLNGTAGGGFTFMTFLSTGNTPDVIALDANLDGIQDLAVAQGLETGLGQIGVFLGLGSGGVGNGQFGPGTSYSAGADMYQLSSADLNGDGRPEILGSAFLGNFVAILTGACQADLRKPAITSVRDVPNDQGLRVFVTWTASSLDVSGGSVENYRVWRRIPAATALPRLSLEGEDTPTILVRSVDGPNGTSSLEYWEALATLPAQRLPGYGYTAATTQDSLKNSNPYTSFFVSALTNDINVFYSSAPDSGYSVDNIKPKKPKNFAATYSTSGVAMSWTANDESDLLGYEIHRGITADFEPAEENLIATPDAETEAWLDPSGAGGLHYKLIPVDHNGNLGPFAYAAIPATADVGGRGTVLAIHGASPNPARSGAVTLALSLATAAPAELEILDLAGRRLVDRSLGQLPAGDHRIRLDEGRPLAPGLYVARLQQAGQRREMKFIVTR